jgi:hypothetical protein
MHEAPSALTAWSNFYVVTGSSAAALTGLMFVVVTLVAGNRTRQKGEGLATFSTPTVVHFCVALLVSAILSAPWRSLVHVAVMLGLAGLYGVVYTKHVMHHARRLSVYRPDFEDWLWHTVLPFVAYAAIVGAAIRIAFDPTVALFAAGGAVMLLIFIGIHNAWDVVTYLVVLEAEESANATGATTVHPSSGGKDEPPPGPER